MALQVDSIAPNSLPTGGRRLVVVRGAGFRLPPAPSTRGITPVRPPSVRAYVGGWEAPDVRVLSPTLLHLIVPAANPGLQDLLLENVDADGNVVDSLNIPDAFTYARPNLNRVNDDAHPERTTEYVLQRITRELLRMLKREVIENVQQTVASEFDDTPDGSNIAMLATVPGLVLAGPQLARNRMDSENSPRRVVKPDGTVVEQRQARTTDLQFTLIGVDDSSQRLLALMQEVELFFERNHYVRLSRLPGQKTDLLEYELDFQPDGDARWTPVSGNSNIRAFSGSFFIRGVDLDEDNMDARIVPPTREVSPAGSIVKPSPVVLLGTPGVALPPPAPSGPTPEVGAGGSIEQIPPTGVDE